MHGNKMTKEDVEMIKEEERIMMEKLKQVESTRSYVTFFNYHALKLIKKSKV